MSLFSKLQDHTNIIDSRNHAVKLMTRKTGLAFFWNGDRVAKGRIIKAVKSGLLDGYFYNVDYSAKRVHLHFHNSANHLHKIGV